MSAMGPYPFCSPARLSFIRSPQISMKHIFLLAVSALLFTTACKQATNVTSREDDLRGEGGWKQTSGRVKYRVPGTNIDSNSDYWKDVPACYKDNRFIFEDVNAGTLQYGANRCDPGEPTSRYFFWQLLEGDEVLELNYVGDAFFGAEPMRGQITEFTGSNMTLVYSTRDTLPGQNLPTTFTYTNGYSK